MDDKKIYTCQKCGAQFLKWFGQCPECGAWGTIEKSPSNERAFSSVNKELVVKNLSSINRRDINRLSSGFSDLDRALGGGIVPGSLILLSGEPGIGKSTFVLQIAGNLKRQVLYISGEESLEQIKIRADRLGIEQKLIHISSTQDVSEIIQLTKKLKPSLLIVDSIQSLCSYFSSTKSGSVNQIRTATASLMELAKSMNIPIFIIGHITKDGLIAGPKTLEHLVDVVLCFEGDPYHYFRLLRVNKNRFGPTQEVAVFEMKKQGLKEVKDSSILFLNKGKQRLPGS
ncbi:MAG TPA: DNA repair protein RadA, partial [Bacteroidetes bacterium]|nr:DNA repair protein RadA [Bacteroidota bacterium]